MKTFYSPNRDNLPCKEGKGNCCCDLQAKALTLLKKLADDQPPSTGGDPRPQASKRPSSSGSAS